MKNKITLLLTFGRLVRTLENIFLTQKMQSRVRISSSWHLFLNNIWLITKIDLNLLHKC